MTPKDEILEFSVELSRMLAPDITVITDMNIEADVLRFLSLNVTTTQLTEQSVDVTKDISFDSEVNRVMEWELEL